MLPSLQVRLPVKCSGEGHVVEGSLEKMTISDQDDYDFDNDGTHNSNNIVNDTSNHSIC